MLEEFKRAIRFTAVAMLLFGGAYSAALWAIGRIAFPTQAEGSLVHRADGTVVGSRLIAQKFTRPEYFHPRPSGVDYNAAATGGTNFGPSNPDHLEAVRSRTEALAAEEHASPDRIPSEMITTSGGGLDPHIPPDAAELQSARVAVARGIPLEQLRSLVEAHTRPPTFGFLGRARVNVLELNIALDDAWGPPRAVATAR